MKYIHTHTHTYVFPGLQATFALLAHLALHEHVGREDLHVRVLDLLLREHVAVVLDHGWTHHGRRTHDRAHDRRTRTGRLRSRHCASTAFSLLSFFNTSTRLLVAAAYKYKCVLVRGLACGACRFACASWWWLFSCANCKRRDAEEGILGFDCVGVGIWLSLPFPPALQAASTLERMRVSCCATREKKTSKSRKPDGMHAPIRKQSLPTIRALLTQVSTSAACLRFWWSIIRIARPKLMERILVSVSILVEKVGLLATSIQLVDYKEQDSTGAHLSQRHFSPPLQTLEMAHCHRTASTLLSCTHTLQRSMQQATCSCMEHCAPAIILDMDKTVSLSRTSSVDARSVCWQ